MITKMKINKEIKRGSPWWKAVEDHLDEEQLFSFRNEVLDADESTSLSHFFFKKKQKKKS